MRSLTPYLLSALVFVISASVGMTQPAPDQVVVDTNNWSDLYKAYRHLGRKADGVVAGAFTDKVSTLLAERWDLLDELSALGHRDEQFIKFVMSNINEATPAHLGSKIRHNATNLCPSKEQRALCQKIIQSLEKVDQAVEKLRKAKR